MKTTETPITIKKVGKEWIAYREGSGVYGYGRTAKKAELDLLESEMSRRIVKLGK